MREVILQKSSNKDKNDAFINGKKVSFGATGYSDFTQHKDEDRKKSYIARHKTNQNWNDLKQPVRGLRIYYGISLLFQHP